MSVHAAPRRPLHLREVPRDSLAQRNALCRAHRPVAVQWLGRVWSLSLSPLHDDMPTPFCVQADWGGAEVIVGFGGSTVRRLGELALDGLWLPDQPPQLAMALLAHVCDDLTQRAERALRRPLQWMNVQRPPAMAADWVRVGWTMGDSDMVLMGSLWLDAAAARFLTAALRSLPHAPADAGNDWGDIPCALRFLLGWTELSGDTVRKLQPYDVVLMDESFLTPDGGLHVQVSPQLGFKAQWDGAQITVLDSLKAIMSDPTYIDSQSEHAILDDLPVRLSFDLGERTLPLSELRALQPGHVFNLGRDPRASVLIRANGKLVGEGELVDVEGRVGVALLRLGQMAD